MHLMRNIICNVVLIAVLALIYGIAVIVRTLIKLGKKNKNKDKKNYK